MANRACFGRLAGLFLSAAIAVGVAGQARAASLNVSPVTFDVVAPQATTSLVLRNSGTVPIYAQVRVFGWRLVDGREVLEQTSRVAASPPIQQVPPGGEQIVRIVRIGDAPLEGQEAYRLLIDELPSDPTRIGPSRVALNLRYSLPVFFTPDTARRADLAWSIERSGAGHVLRIRNGGGDRARLSAASVAAGGQERALAEGLLGYVLADSFLDWPLPPDLAAAGAGNTVTVRARVDGRETEHVLAVP
ncbi:molecular chaperone [Zavarzinia compransoris]|uniref:fimbrial biogenesis chaperone n=1 Tax=Zavarzinia marina TaxID=2911065 RepID=UPI001F21D087|nr:molecular chaperone [Zavarzinia marina]MCF4164228.1 molecular chaperone [Zavarzinia marina]